MVWECEQAPPPPRGRKENGSAIRIAFLALSANFSPSGLFIGSQGYINALEIQNFSNRKRTGEISYRCFS